MKWSKLLALLTALAIDPYSWAVLAAIVIIGVLAYYFWDGIRAVFEEEVFSKGFLCYRA